MTLQASIGRGHDAAKVNEVFVRINGLISSTIGVSNRAATALIVQQRMVMIMVDVMVMKLTMMKLMKLTFLLK